ncbi:tetratricopeptide repeat protein [Cytophaga aurantiaca]|uniref:tetratricopeptide repeat protein n=1 Tax=Cytophaga aurantiaca TaxID=29530 RepID=UPI00036C59CE|nr:tetratricopeptide repeat protein [Cytophaga aurantiaca]
MINLILIFILIVVPTISNGQELFEEISPLPPLSDEFCTSFKYNKNFYHTNYYLKPEVVINKIDSLFNLFTHDNSLDHCDSVKMSEQLIQKSFLLNQTNKLQLSFQTLLIVKTYNLNREYLQYAYGNYYIAKGDSKLAEKYLIPISIDSANKYYNSANESLADFYFSKMKYEKSIKCLDKSLNYFENDYLKNNDMPVLPEYIIYIILRGDCYYKLGKTESACMDWKKAATYDTYKLFEEELNKKLLECK